jgi:serine/threonine protein kinase
MVMGDHNHPEAKLDALLREAAQPQQASDRVVDIVAARLFRKVAAPPSIGRYELLEILGSGGMGTVYAARDPQRDRKVAIKVVRTTESGEAATSAEARLVREARLAARLHHPNVVEVLEQGLHDGCVFVVMELIDGVQLDRWLAMQARPWADVLTPFMQAGAGLAAAHAIGIVHRDFKPANVLVGTDGQARVLDFGLARPIAHGLRGRLPPPREQSFEYKITNTGKVSGTPDYMAPELFTGSQANPQTDIYAFCVALLDAWSGDSSEPQRAPGPAIDVLLRGVTHDPCERWASMAELLTALDRATSKRRRPLDYLRAWMGPRGTK